jgi:hypothetical protein
VADAPGSREDYSSTTTPGDSIDDIGDSVHGNWEGAMREAFVESESSAASPFAYGTWLAVALRERERRASAPRAGSLARSVAGPVVEPSIDRDACAAWLAAAPARDDHEASR